MDYLKSFFVDPASPSLPTEQPRLPDLNHTFPNANSSPEIRTAISLYRLVVIVAYSKSGYKEVGDQQEAYDQLLVARDQQRAHHDYGYFKCDVDALVAAEGGGKDGDRAVRKLLGLHARVMREGGAGLSLYRDGKLLGSLEGEEMMEYGVVEEAMNAVF
jgi:hypothetical protein